MSSSRSKVKSLLLASLFVVAGVSAAHALTLDEQRQFDEWSKYYASAEGHAGAVKQSCGIDVPVKLDTAFVTPFMTAGRNAASYCDEALNAISKECGDDLGKKAVAAKVKSVSCTYSAKSETSMKLADGELQFTFGADSANLSDEVKKFLDGNL